MRLNAYYFRQHMYTLVPHQVREDMQWMADTGTNCITLAVLEQDLIAAQANLDILFAEAERVGMAVHVVPSRWGGLFAGAPKVPSSFTAMHPETWILHEDGRPYHFLSVGPLSSVHHPATLEFYDRTLETLLTQWPVAGLMLDEPKSFSVKDYSPAAREARPADADEAWEIQATAAFHDKLGQLARKYRPDIVMSLFLYAHIDQPVLDACAAIENLDDFGCDGRPWGGDAPPQDTDHPHEKNLLGQAPRFIKAARAHGKRPLFLIENHNMPTACNATMDRCLPEVLQLDVEHVLYYYYPRNVPDPDAQMALLRTHLRRYASDRLATS